MSYKSKQYIMFAGITTLVFVAVVIAPFIYGLYLTFTSWDGVSRDKPFVGLANYVATFQDSAFWAALGRTFFYSIIAVILVNVVLPCRILYPEPDRRYRSWLCMEVRI